jgi:hypothetical protein
LQLKYNLYYHMSTVKVKRNQGRGWGAGGRVQGLES